MNLDIRALSHAQMFINTQRFEVRVVQQSHNQMYFYFNPNNENDLKFKAIL